ncbi:uncharacterized protein LOC123316070 isoform X3 [Coccinella septempunctata]|uniref:uncharacterized protein LOC123316070 isoform X3 n=1 Tax=Coccinella septempunctata TaxID=41139 RepID=UPI001D07578D|nr:uncharacterized protein LOC123316070 isoform X3 [Coccinella septempunctata]
MKKLIFFCSVLALGTAKPNGYFHQEYSYKSSSSSYKNNELQHKKDDQGFYSKDGDLEGRVKPKVNSQSQHTEYTNPKLLGASGGYQTAAGLSNGANYMAGSDRLYAGVGGLQSAGAVDGYASSDRVLDLANVYNTRGYGSNQGLGTLQAGRYVGTGSNYGYTQGGSSYGYMQHGSSQSSSGSYVSNANLNALMQRLQDDMTRQLQQAIYSQHQSSGYSTSSNQMNADIRLLEEELKRNLTRQLQDSLRTQYGTNTYSIVEGRPSTAPDYSNQELAALTRRLEDDLISKLHQSVRTTYNSQTSNTYTSSNTYRPVVVYPATTLRPYYDRPVITTPNTIRYTMIPSRETISYPGKLTVETPTNIRYTPVPNPESLTQIASRTQSEVNSYLDTALQNLYSTYLQADRTSYYTMTDFENEVNRIKSDILRNLTYNLDDQIRRNYGHQVLKNDYYYSVSTNGDLSTQSNYNLGDYESLKKQVEDNLLRKLKQTVDAYREQYQRYLSQYRESSSNTYSVTYRPVYYTSGNQMYDYSDLQRQMSQQLQNALNKHRYSQSSSYSASASYNPQAYQTSLDELSRELQRNLTEQLSNFRASSSSSSSYGYSSGSGGNADFESMKNQLQNQLMQQLRQGLQNQHHYSASASYSASSSSSANANYGMRQAYGSYPTTCLHGCSKRRRRDLYQNSYSTVNKRHGVKSVRRFYSTPTGSNADLSSSPRYLYHPEELSYSHGMNSPSYNNHLKRHQELDPDIVEDLGITNHQTAPKRDDQQLEQKPYKYTINYDKQNELTQQLEETQPLPKINDDLSQQLEVGHRTTQKIYRFSGKLEDQNESTQQLEISAPGSRSHHKLRQYEQELEGQLSLNSPSFGQRLEGQNTIGHVQKPEHFGRKLERQSNSDQEILGQQLEDQNLIGNLHKPKNNDQELEGQLNIDQQTLGQELEDQNLMGNLHGPKHDDQELQGQDQQMLGQHLEDQNTYRKQSLGEQEIEGQLSLGQEDQATIKPRQHNQELVGQLHLEQQSLGQQLEDQNQMINLHKPKRKHNFQEQQTGDDQNQLELTQKLEPDDLPGPKMVLGQQLEEQNQMINLHKPKRKPNFQEQQTGDDQNQLELTQKLELDDLPEPKMDLGQQLEEQNQLINLHKPKRKHNFQEQQTGDDQNQLELTQKLEPDDLPEPKMVLGQQLQEIPTQELELGSVPKKRTNSDEKLEGSDQLMQQLETIGSGKPNYGGYAQQQSDIDLQSPDQQLTDLSQQLELTKPLYSKPSPAVAQLELKPVQKQIENDDDLQQLELEEKPKHTQPSQQLDNDLTQQLEIEGSINGKTNSDQQLQNQEDLDQSLELIGGPAPKPGRQEQRQVDSPLFLQSIPKNTDQVQRQADDLTQQLEELGKPQQQTPETDFTQQLILTNSQKPNLNQVQQQIEDSTGDLPAQKLEATVRNPTHGPEQQQEDLLTDQRLEEPEQKLELNGLSQTNIKPQQTIVNQEVDDGLSQQLELGDVQKPQKGNFASGQQQETDFTPLEFVGGRKRKPNHQYHPTLESELSLTPEKRHSENDLVNQPERSFRHHSQHSSIELNAVGQSKHYPSQTFGNYDLPGSYRQESEQRAFTNGHSGHFTGNTFPSLGSQVRVDSYENALKQQDALMDLLKEKVDSLGIYGKRTIKKTVFINGKPVETQESSQLIKPNGEVIPLGATSLPSKSIYSPFGSAPISQSSNYFGENLRPTYHLTSPTFSGKTQLFTQGRTFEQNPSSLFETDLLNGGLRRESEFSGKTTRRVVHYVNGKPVSASEKIQITKPNGEVIEKNHELPTDQLNSLTRGFPNSQFEHGIHTLNVPQIQISSQIAGDSKQTIQRTHYVSSKLVGSSSQGVSQNEQRSVIEDSLPRNENNYSFGTKTSRHFGSGSY